MASYQTLDIAVKIDGNFGALDRLANKLDEVDRKAKQVRNIPVDVDVDGDSEAVGRLSAVEDAAESADEDVDIDVDTNIDTNRLFGDIRSKFTDLEDRFSELGDSLDIGDDVSVGDNIDDNPFEDLQQQFEGSVIGDDTAVDSSTVDVESTARELRTELENAVRDDRPTPTDVTQTIERQYEGEGRPSVADLTRTIEQEYGDVDSPLTEDLSQRIEHEFADVDHPSVEDVTRTVRTRFAEYDTSSVEDLTRTIHTQYDGDEQPSIEDTKRVVRQNITDIDDTVLDDVSQEIQREFEREEPSSIEDLTRRVRTVFNEYDISHISDERRTVHTQFAETEVPQTVQDLRVSVDNADIENALEQTRRLKQQFSELDRPALEQRSDTVRQTIERSLSTDDDIDTDFIQSQLSNLEDQVYEVDTRVAVDTTQLDTEAFSEKLQSLKQNLGDERQFYAEMGVDVDDARQQLTAIQSRFENIDSDVDTDVEDIGLDVREVREYTNRLSELEDRFENVSNISQEFASIQDDISAMEGRLFEDADVDVDDSADVKPSQFHNKIQTVDDRLVDLRESVKRTVSDSRFESLPSDDSDTSRRINTEVTLDDNAVLQRITALRGALTTLDDTVVDVDVDTDMGGRVSSLREGHGGLPSFGGDRSGGISERLQSFKGRFTNQVLPDAGFRGRDDGDDDSGGRSRLRSIVSDVPDIGMSSLNDVIAKATPLMLTFVGALPAAIGGLIGLGGAALSAAGALGAVGALSVGGLALTLGDGNLQQGLEQIRSELVADARSAFAPLAQQFSGLGQDALDGVGRFFDRLAQEGQALTQLKDEARSFGEWLFTNIPQAIDDIVALAEAFSPVFGMLGNWAANTDFAGIFASLAANALPAIMEIVDAFLTMLPTIMEFSQGMLTVTTVVFQFWSIVWSVIDVLGPFAEYLGIAAGALFTLYSTVMLSRFAMTAFNTVMGVNAVQSLVAFMGGIGRAVMSLFGYTAAAGAATTATTVFATALGTLLTMTGIGLLLPLIGAIGGQFMGTKGSIDEATSSLKDFKDMRDKLGSGSSGINNPYGPLEHGDMTNIDPNEPTQSGVQGQSGQQNITVNDNRTVDNSTEINGDGSRDSQELKTELSHDRFRQKENSSKPY